MAADAPHLKAADTRGRWVFGPAQELLLCCGGIYLPIFLMLVIAAPELQWLAPQRLLPLLVLVTGVPHYGATLLRVYQKSEDVERYRLFSVWLTGLVYLVFVIGVYDVTIGSIFFTLYVTWNPWHYAGQNYGISLMLLKRHGVTVTPTAKRALYASFVLSVAMVILSLHGDRPNAVTAPVSLQDGGYHVISLGIPFAGELLLLAAGGYLMSLAVSLYELRRKGRWRAIAPAGLLLITQALWFSIPTLALGTGYLANLLPFTPSYAEYAFLWIGISHSVQYLCITTWYADGSGAGRSHWPYLARTLLAGGAIWVVPMVLFGPALLGVRAVDSGHALLVAAAVNLHHFILDGAIWKLRDGRIARVLLRVAPTPATGPTPPSRRRRWLGVAVSVLGCAYLVHVVVGTLELEFGVQRALDPPRRERIETALKRLQWVGRDHADARYNLAVLSLESRDFEAARREAERSLELGPTPRAWLALGEARRHEQHWDEALSAYQQALALDPRNVHAWERSASMWARQGQRRRAQEALQRAIALAPERAELRARLERLETNSLADDSAPSDP